MPNADHAIIEQSKLEGYLLSEVHPVGRFKARFFARLGFTADNWRELDAALRSQHLPESATPGPVEAFGQSFTIRPSSRGRAVRPGDQRLVCPHGRGGRGFVTAYPGGKA